MPNDIINKKKFVPIWVLAVYCVFLYGMWTVYHFFVLPQINKLPGELLPSILNDGICKNLIWTLPAILLIRKFGDDLAVKPNEMLTWKKEYAKYLLLFPASAAYILLGIFVKTGIPAMSLTISEIITVIFVGVSEELVFRAWLLNATSKRSEYAAIAVNAVMFLIIHFPRWITQGIFAENMMKLGFVSIIGLSVVFSLVFLKTKNIVLAIALHMFWDLQIFLFM